MTIKNLPKFDDDGNNLADPNDGKGYKSAYIQKLQEHAIQKYVSRGTGGLALDLGCGFGRMGAVLNGLNYDLLGLDPSMRVLRSGINRECYLGLCNGALPDMPFRDETFDLVCLLGVARMVHLLGRADICGAAAKLVKPGGRLVVIDNLRKDDARYLPEEWFDQAFCGDGLRRVRKVAIRASRWPIIYLIRYGLVSERWFDAIAQWELWWMSRKTCVPRFSYFNYLFIYERP